MPLHAVTAMYGEQGLRARFAAEIARFPDPAGRERAARALRLAGHLHAADRRQREPYVNHLLRVALRIIRHYGVNDLDVICAALLHDAVEDHADGLAAGGRAAAVAALAEGSARGPPAWSTRSPTPSGCPAVIGTSSTGSSSRPAWPPTRGRG